MALPFVGQNQKLEFTVTTTTPAFLRRDADSPEFRAPSFRGLFRYWFRACAGAVLQDVNREKLFALESSVWGDTARASNIGLRVWADESKQTKAYLLPHKEREKEKALAKAIPAGHSFSLLLSPRGRVSTEAWEAAKAIARLALLLGGVGARSRRGFGSCLITVEAQGDTTLNVNVPKDRSAWEAHITQTVSDALQATATLAKKQGLSASLELPPKIASFPTLNTLGNIYLGKTTYKETELALTRLMQDLHGTKLFLGSAASKKLNTKRQASPLWIRVIPVSGGYSLLFTVLASKLVKSLDYNELDKFLKTLALPVRTMESGN